MEPDVGPVIIAGDIAPPFTMGDRYTEVIHDEARRTIDALKLKMVVTFAGLAVIHPHGTKAVPEPLQN